MALIARFEEISGNRHAVHGSVECGWRFFKVDGKQILQLETYGSDEREFKGKVSQSIQLDESSAAKLLEIIDRSFPTLVRRLSDRGAP